MSSEEEKEKHKNRRTRNKFAKVLFDPNEFKGAFSMKVIGPKNKYKRERLNPRTVEVDFEENE